MPVMQVIQAQSARSWGLTITSITNMSGRRAERLVVRMLHQPHELGAASEPVTRAFKCFSTRARSRRLLTATTATSEPLRDMVQALACDPAGLPLSVLEFV
jgi:hypothetical protein